jgi:tetratricopeptide (TPR) repeat protein
MFHRSLCWIVCVALLPNSAVHADETWVGKQVMQKKMHVDFGDRVDGKQVYFELKSVILPVLKEQDGWLRVRDFDDREGWVDKNDFVLLPEAPAYFTQVVRMNPGNTWGWLQRGVAWRGVGKLEFAISDNDSALRINRASAAAYYFRGVVWKIEKQYDKAIADLTQAIWLKPQADYAFDVRGNVWQSKKEYEKALKDFDQAIRLSPNCAVGYRNKAYLLATCASDQIRDVAKSRELIKIVLDLRKSSPYNEATLGVIAAAEGKFDEAIKLQKKALEDVPYGKVEGAIGRERLKAYAQKQSWRE